MYLFFFIIFHYCIFYSINLYALPALFYSFCSYCLHQGHINFLFIVTYHFCDIISIFRLFYCSFLLIFLEVIYNFLKFIFFIICSINFVSSFLLSSFLIKTIQLLYENFNFEEINLQIVPVTVHTVSSTPVLQKLFLKYRFVTIRATISSKPSYRGALGTIFR